MSSNLDKVAEALRALEKDAGRLIPADVVDAARRPDSPLHSHFEWDDSAAAEKFRLDQARALIRTVKIEVTVREVPLQVCSYVRDPDADTADAGYRSVVKLRSEQDSARAAIVEEMKRVANAVRRAKSLAAVLGMTDEFTQIDAMVRTLSERVSDRMAA